MPGILQDKVTVITGSTRGFGLEIARAYARQGACRVLLNKISGKPEQEIKMIVTNVAPAIGARRE